MNNFRIRLLATLVSLMLPLAYGSSELGLRLVVVTPRNTAIIYRPILSID